MRKSMILTFDFRKKWNVLIIIWDVMCILDLVVEGTHVRKNPNKFGFSLT